MLSILYTNKVCEFYCAQTTAYLPSARRFLQLEDYRDGSQLASQGVTATTTVRDYHPPLPRPNPPPPPPPSDERRLRTSRPSSYLRYVPHHDLSRSVSTSCKKGRMRPVYSTLQSDHAPGRLLFAVVCTWKTSTTTPAKPVEPHSRPERSARTERTPPDFPSALRSFPKPAFCHPAINPERKRKKKSKSLPPSDRRRCCSFVT